MRILVRAKNDYLNYLHELDMAAQEMAKSQTNISLQFEGRYQQAKKKASDHLHQWVYGVVGCILAFLFLYQNIGNVFINLFFGFIGLSLVMLGWRYLISYQVFKDVKSEWDQKFAMNETMAASVANAKKKAASCAINMIVFSENYEELMAISTMEERKTVYRVLMAEYLDAFQFSHHNQATYEDYLAYYLKWEASIEA
ncbi:MAG: hypothetical protein WCQ80_00400 [Bacilli bacterium]